MFIRCRNLLTIPFYKYVEIHHIVNVYFSFLKNHVGWSQVVVVIRPL